MERLIGVDKKRKAAIGTPHKPNDKQMSYVLPNAPPPPLPRAAVPAHYITSALLDSRNDIATPCDAQPVSGICFAVTYRSH